MNRAMSGLLRVYEVVEKTIIVVLLVVLMVIVLWVTGVFTFQMLGLLVQRIAGGPEINNAMVGDIVQRLAILHDVFGTFLLLLIGVELMKTIAIYLLSHEMHVEVVFTVAIIAIARHAIDLDLKNMDPMQLVGLGVLVMALAVGYFFFRKATALPGATVDSARKP